MHQQFDYYKAIARERWGTCTAFRLGYVVALCSASLPCPYESARSVRLYRDGLNAGVRERENKLKELQP